MHEEWRLIPGYGGFYNVSNMGRVCSTKTGAVFIKKAYENEDGYLKVKIGCGSISRVVSIHRLVAALFIGDVSNKEVNHIDGNKKNNCVSNLEICTHKENMKHAFDVLHINNKGMSGRFGRLHHLSKKICQIDLKGNVLKEYDSVMDASRYTKLRASNISKAALGKAHTCGGFKWSYK